MNHAYDNFTESWLQGFYRDKKKGGIQSWASKAMDTFKYKPHRRQKTIVESREVAWVS